MSSAQIRLQQAAKELRKATDSRYSKTETAIVAGAVGSAYVAIAGNIAKAQLPDGASGEIEVVNSGRLASAVYTTKAAGGSITVVRGVSSSGGGSGDIATAITLHKAEADPHPGYLTPSEGNTLYLSKFGTGQLEIPVTGSSPYEATYTSLSSLAGNGLGFTTAFNVLPGTLISVALGAVNLASGTGQYQVPVTGSSPTFTPAYTSLVNFAGNGLTFATDFAVGQGNGITVSTNAVAANIDTVRGISFVSGAIAMNINTALGLEFVSGALGVNLDTAKGINFVSGAIAVTLGVGMTFSGGAVVLGTPSSLDVNTINASTGTTHAHAVVTSSNPGPVEAILSSSGAGGLTLVTLTTTNRVTTPLVTNAGPLTISTSTGDITISPVGNVLYPNARSVRSVTFNSGLTITGWQINEVSSGTSALTIGTISVDELRAKVFVADEVRVDRGEQVWGKSFGIVESEFVTPSAIGGDGVNIWFENAPAMAGAIFSNADWLRLRIFDRTSGFTIANVWGQVYTAASGAIPGYLLDSTNNRQRWRFVLRQGPTSYEVKKGITVIDYGASGQPYIFLSAVDPAGAPYIKFNVWSGSNPFTAANQTTTTIIGSLKSIFGIVNENGFAGGTGFTTADQYVKASNEGVIFNNVDGKWKASGTDFLTIDATSGIRIIANTAYVSNRAYTFYDGTDLGGTYMYSQPFGRGLLLRTLPTTKASQIQVLSEANAGQTAQLILDAKTGSNIARISLNIATGGERTIAYSADTHTIASYGTPGAARVNSDGFYSDALMPGTLPHQTSMGVKGVRMGVSGSSPFIVFDAGSGSPSWITGGPPSLQLGHGSTLAVAISSTSINLALPIAPIQIGGATPGTNLNKLTTRHGAGVTLGLANSNFGYASALLMNASLLSEASSMVAAGACIYRGPQYTGNVTAPGMLYYDGNANFWGLYIGQQGLVEGAAITWSQKLRVDKFGNLQLNGQSAAGGEGVLAMKTCNNLPESAPTGGGIIFINGGALFYMGSNGTLSKVANA